MNKCQLKNRFLNNNAFTLVETLIALAVTIVLATIVIKFYNNFTIQTKDKNIEVFAQQESRAASEYLVNNIILAGLRVPTATAPIDVADSDNFVFKYTNSNAADEEIDKYVKVGYRSNYPSGFSSFGNLIREVLACDDKTLSSCSGTAIDGSTYSKEQSIITSLALDEGGANPYGLSFLYYDKDGNNLNVLGTDVIGVNYNKIAFVQVTVRVSTSEKVRFGNGTLGYKIIENSSRVKLRNLNLRFF